MKKKIGFALTGSFCTLSDAFSLMEELKTEYEIVPILSERVVGTDTRFFQKEEVIKKAKEISGRDPLCTLPQVEPLGPEKMVDLLLICPCTGNTLSKMAHGITDTSVTMAAKSHRRAGGKVLIALSSNDALSGSAESLGKLLDKKGFYFVPLRQDSPNTKPNSLQSDFSLIPKAIEKAFKGENLQPVLFS